MAAITMMLAFSAVVSDAYVIKTLVWSKSATSNSQQITCWTCPNMTSNDACNDWAPDVRCPHEHTVCLTSHTIDRLTGSSAHVHKRCAQPSECNRNIIGCHLDNTERVLTCTSCCTESYCNERVPHNHQTALMYSSRVSGSMSSRDINMAAIFVVVLMHAGIRMIQP